ncbi:MAG: hypothetical protein QM647_08705 [Asticcacaulis sp.]|uniref:hypothetical protein n=1 Tax=Asticcacaulis sp. TaxID=1872648 RepID=UPI0039E2529A
MTTVKQSILPLWGSYALALATALFQANAWGLGGFYVLSVSTPLAIVSFAAWFFTVLYIFRASPKVGLYALIGVVPAFASLWIIGLIYYACSQGSCV